KPIYSFHQALDILLVRCEEVPKAKFLRFAPAVLSPHVPSNISCRKSVQHDWHFVHQLNRVSGHSRRELMRDNRKQDNQGQVHLNYCRASQVFKKERMPLQESDNGIYQIGKEYGKNEDKNDTPRAVNGYAHHTTEKCSQQRIKRAAVGECHSSCYRAQGGCLQSH